MNRAVVLVAVLVLVAIAALAAAGLLARSGVSAESSAASVRASQLRMVASSGVEILRRTIEQQRPALLRGGAPTLPESWTIYKSPGGERGVVRLVSLGQTSEGTSPQAVSENAKIDINVCDPAFLAGVLDEAAAGDLTALRQKGSFACVEDARAELAEGVESGVPREPEAKPAGEAKADHWELATCFAFEPRVIAPEGEAKALPQVDLSGGVTADSAAAILDGLPPDAASAVRPLLVETAYASRGAFLSALQRAGVAVEHWSTLSDRVCFSPDPFGRGSIDMNRADVGVLALVPGLDGAIARSIVETRSRLDEEKLSRITWPLEQGLLTTAQFLAMCDHVSVRSTVWRVRLVVQIERDQGGSNRELLVLASSEWDAVVDASGESAQIALWRDASVPNAAFASVGEPRPSLIPESISPAALPTEGKHNSRSDERSALDPDDKMWDDAGRPAVSPDPKPASDNRIGRWAPR
jgi:hypothetical protein